MTVRPVFWVGQKSDEAGAAKRLAQAALRQTVCWVHAEGCEARVLALDVKLCCAELEETHVMRAVRPARAPLRLRWATGD